MNIDSLTIRDAKKVKWSAQGYDFIPDQFCVHRDGGSAFNLELKDGTKNTWLIFNSDPEADQYANREEFLSAVACTDHQMPCIGSRRFDKGASIIMILKWAIVVYKKHGWTTADPFTQSLRTRKVAA